MTNVTRDGCRTQMLRGSVGEDDEPRGSAADRRGDLVDHVLPRRAVEREAHQCGAATRGTTHVHRRDVDLVLAEDALSDDYEVLTANSPILCWRCAGTRR